MKTSNGIAGMIIDSFVYIKIGSLDQFLICMANQKLPAHLQCYRKLLTVQDYLYI